MGKSSVRFLSLLRPAMAILPEVEKSPKQVLFKTRVYYTLVATLIYLVCCQIPLYGVAQNSKSDPFYWLRAILASNKGTLMELGISPSVTAGMVMQLLSGAKIIEIDQNSKEDKSLFNGAQKLLGLAIALFEAVAYVYSGMYGEMEQLGAGNALLLVLQLTFSGIIVLLLDELLAHGYGVGNSGISLFIAINMCETIMWKSFSPMTFSFQEGVNEYEGAIVNFFYQLVSNGPIEALQNGFLREQGANVSNLLGTIFIFLVVIYFQGFRVELRMGNSKVKNSSQTYPIKLFYTSNMPIILQSALVSNMFFFSQMLYRNFKGNFLVGLFGTWSEMEGQGYSSPVGGLIYYISPPRGLELFYDPIHSVIYMIFMIGTCALFSKTWIEVSGASVKDVAQQLKEQDMQMQGHREGGLKKKLGKYIPMAAVFGGMCIGALTILADFLGVIGSGTGILLSVTIIYGYFETIKKEKEQGTLEWF